MTVHGRRHRSTKTTPHSTIQHTLVLRRVDPGHLMARFYMLAIERDLFGTVRLVRCWSRIGTRGRELAEEFETELEAAEALERLATTKRRRGYQNL
jgi:predicted DNA-binding WGR domain protein